jgi:hypothetical protein
MPTDVSFENVRARDAASTETRRRSLGGRLPLGIGLAIAACASAGLWIAIAAGVRALLS